MISYYMAALLNSLSDDSDWKTHHDWSPVPPSFLILSCFSYIAPTFPHLLWAPLSSTLLNSLSSVSPFSAFPTLTAGLFCEQLNVYFTSASSSIPTGPLLGGFALLLRILFVLQFAVSIKDEIEISRASTQRQDAARRHMCWLTKQRCAAPSRMKEHKPLVLVLLYLLILLLPLLTLAALPPPPLLPLWLL